MNAIVPRTQTSTAVVPVIQITSFADLMRFAEIVAPTELMPRDYRNKPGNIVVAVQMGSELGLSPMQSIQNISIINGRPAVWGDAMLGLVRGSPKCQDVIETITGEGDARTATCTVKRQGSSDTIRTFSVADAKKAKLHGKDGTWQLYPDRMLAMRARGFACRDSFPDVLRGLISGEEATDMPKDEFRGTTVDHTPEPAPLAKPKAAAQPPARPLSFVEETAAALARCTTPEDVQAIEDGASMQDALTQAPPGVVRKLHAMLHAARQRVEARAAPGAAVDAGEDGDEAMPD